MNRQHRLMTRRFVSAPLAAMVLSLVGVDAAQGQWPQWGGPRSDFVSDSTGLASTWPAEGPRQIWKRDLGDGYAAIVADDGRLYTTYRAGSKEAVIALDPQTGKTIWEHLSDAAPEKGHAKEFGEGPRATPLIAGDHIYAVGVSGEMLCLTKKDGKKVWKQSLWKKFKGNVLQHGYASSPVAYKDMVIVLVGGKDAGIVALNKSDGSVVWKSETFKNGYATPKLITVDGQDQLVTFMSQELVAVDPNDGKLQWRYPHEDSNMSQPIWSDADNMLLVSGAQQGSRGLRLTVDNGETKVEEVWATRKVKFFHVNSIAVGDHVYGSSGSSGASFFSAINIKTGKIAWRQRGFSLATCLYADGRFIILDEDGRLGLATATPEEFKIQSQADVLKKVSWTVPTLVGANLYLRDLKTIVALDLG